MAFVQLVTSDDKDFITSDNNNFMVVTPTFGIGLYKNTADKLVLDKSLFLDPVGILYGSLRDRCDVINPRFIIERESLPVFNYVSIPIWNRYYYVNDIVSVRYGFWEISLTVDERMSYKSEIMALKDVIIGRAEDPIWWNPYFTDNQIPVESGLNYTVIEISNSTFSRAESAYPFVLAVIAKSS